MIKAQILVVEDQAATADLILEVLRAEGYEVFLTDNYYALLAVPPPRQQPPLVAGH